MTSTSTCSYPRCLTAPPSRRGGKGTGGSEDGQPALTADDDLIFEEIERPRRTSRADHFLQIALSAQREIARLQGLYHYIAPPEQDIRYLSSPYDPDDLDDDDLDDDPDDFPPTRPNSLN